MVGKTILAWMVEQDRTLAYLSQQSGLDVDTLVGLIVGEADVDVQGLTALEQTMNLSPGALGPVATSIAPDAEPTDSLRCFTVKEVASRLRVSEDVVRQEMATGKLWYIIVGVRGQRIPWGALQDRISQWERGWVIAPGHVIHPLFRPGRGGSGHGPADGRLRPK